MRTPDAEQPATGMSAKQLAQAITAPPFNTWLGVRLDRIDDHGLHLVMPWREEIASNPQRGYAHGGALATLIDIATFYVVAARVGTGGPTVDLRVDYHRPAMPGPLHVTSTILRLGRTLATAEARITQPDGTLIASGRAVFLVGKPPQPKLES